MRKIIAANTISQLIGRVIGAATTVAVTFLIARQIGAEGYGDFVKITTYAAFFYLVVDFGINAIFLRHDERGAWPALIVLRTVGGAALIAASLCILFLLPGSAGQGYTHVVKLGILLFSPTILFQGFIMSSNAIFQKRLRYDFAARAIFFGSVATLFMFLRPVDLLTAVCFFSAGMFVTAVFSFAFALRLVGRIRFSATAEQMKKLLLPSIPLGITLLFNLVYFRADSVIITLTRPTAEVGIYGLAYKVFEVILVFPTFFMNSVYPMLVSEKLKVKSEKFKSIIVQSGCFLLVTSLASLIMVWFAAPLLSLIKNDFTPSITALRVLSLGLPFFFVTSAMMWALIALKKQWALAVIYGTAMIINIAGNILLVPSYGFIAAAWMTVVSEGLVLVLSGYILLKEL